jgi:hypothetical protein
MSKIELKWSYIYIYSSFLLCQLLKHQPLSLHTAEEEVEGGNPSQSILDYTFFLSQLKHNFLSLFVLNVLPHFSHVTSLIVDSLFTIFLKNLTEQL